ncbi:fructose-1-6-bisphosphatase-domain-containing protein [Xylariaceae sp. FL0804]|nr:fructose-1-6-bisphosphatase-domain-containing protein [Xylariaceae sp. FL0804]
MASSGKCALLVSEEEEDIIYFKDQKGARYAVACDPIDGSSNLDAGVSVGTIFGIHKLEEGSTGTKEDILKPGTELLAAGFTMYGASAQLVITMKGGTVNGFTLDTSFGEFILTHPDMSIPKSRAIYSVNEGNSLYWEDSTKNYFNSLKYPQDNGKPYSARYIGSMVADAYRTLLYGGIFAYPSDKKSPKGKLRILYECHPMAMVFENGKQPGPVPDKELELTMIQPAARLSTARWTGCWRWCRRISTTGPASSWAAMMRWSWSRSSINNRKGVIALPLYEK